MKLERLIDKEVNEYGPALFRSDHKEKREKLERIKEIYDD